MARQDRTNVLEEHLLPLNSTVGEQGLRIGGCDVAALAEEFGTPLFIYDEAHLRTRCRETHEVFGPHVAYASKAFSCRAMASIVSEEGLGIDVASGGELDVALAAGMDPKRVVFHGNNKSTTELSFALKAGVGRIAVDSFDELERLAELTKDRAQPQPIWLRITPGVEAHTHEFISTGQDDYKFGFTVSTGLAQKAVEIAQATKGLELVGIHAHIGSQVFRVESFQEAALVIAKFFAPLGLGELCVGGGLGVAYMNGEQNPSVMAWGEAVRAAIAEAGISDEVAIHVEPGRSLVAQAAITVYRVGTVKALDGLRSYVAVDGGMSDNPRPVLYGAGYEAFLVREPLAERTLPVRIVGKHCESGDVIVPDGYLPEDVKVGDFLATPVTGAYGYAMASTYNRVTRPAVLFVADGKARVVLRRETYEDLSSLDVAP
ncbi:MAG: diaminopimelate decarboxylase [Actinobacteria bacterium]|nr:diaminopimelate decarboxylase [Actinomycetota bacterium]